MTEEELKEKMDKDLNEVFNVKSIIDFQFDFLQKAYLKGIKTGMKISSSKAKELIKTFLLIADNKVSQMEFQLCVADAKQFLKGESTTEQTNECHDCAKFDEMPNGPRCKTCDNGSHFQKKEEA